MSNFSKICEENLFIINCKYELAISIPLIAMSIYTLIVISSIIITNNQQYYAESD